MPGNLLQSPRPQILDSNGDPVSGGTLEFYVVGTTTPKNVYSDRTILVSIGSTVTLNGSGRPSTDVYLDGSYKVIVKDSSEVTLYTVASINDLTGFSVNIVDDTTPQLGGNLDVQTNKIVSTGDNNIELEVNQAGAGKIILDGPVEIDNSLKVSTVNYPTDTPAAGEVIVATSSTALVFGVAALPTMHLSGLYISNSSGDTEHDIDISVGSARSIGDTANLKLSSTLTKRIDANWVAGTNQGGFPSALTLSNNTTYHVFVIAHTDGTVDAGFDTSLTAANLLTASSYTYYRRIGSVVTDGSANIRNFTRRGPTFFWKDPPLDSDEGSIAAASSSLITLTVPTGIIVEAIVTVFNDDAGDDVYLSPPGIDDEAPADEGGPQPNVHGGDISHQVRILTNTSGQIRARANGADTALIDLTTNGFIDYRDES